MLLCDVERSLKTKPSVETLWPVQVRFHLLLKALHVIRFIMRSLHYSASDKSSSHFLRLEHIYMHIEQESPWITYTLSLTQKYIKDNRRKKYSVNKSIWWRKPVEELVGSNNI